MPSEFHVPVLLEETLRLLDPKPGERAVDCTVGGGGHAQAILDRILPGGFLLAFDRDEEAVRRASERFAGRKESVLVVHESFANLRRFVERMKFRSVDVVLADLGISSRQVDDAARGFSFRRDAPLDMRFSRAMPRTAADLVNTLPEEELTRIFREYGEERWAGPIARMILRQRPLATTLALAETVKAAIPRARWPRDIHPATRVFQALRIAVNAELESLDALLRDAPDLLAPGGRFAVISYHSLEDRAVKHAFRERAAAGGGFRLLSKKPVRPSADEVARNPRARSAKLRGLGRMI